MSYALNGVDLRANYNFIEGHQTGSNIALAGFLDMPERLGKCYHNWDGINGVQPYTSASEIRFGGRTLNLSGAIIGTSREDLSDKCIAFYAFINSITSLVPLVSNTFGSFNVYVNEAIQGTYIGKNSTEFGLSIDISFREPIVNLSGSMPTSDGDLGIDGISFPKLAGQLISVIGDRYNRTAPKSFDTSVWYTEGYRITKTEAPKISIKIFIRELSYILFKAKITNMYALFSSPGERNLLLDEGTYRNVFACNGFKVSEINHRNGYYYGYLNIDLIQSGETKKITYLGDNLGNIINTNSNIKIIL